MNCWLFLITQSFLQCAWVKVELVYFLNTRSLNTKYQRPPIAEECKEYTKSSTSMLMAWQCVIITINLFNHLKFTCLTFEDISWPGRKLEVFLNSILAHFIRKEELLKRVGNCVPFSLGRSEHQVGQHGENLHLFM